MKSASAIFAALLLFLTTSGSAHDFNFGADLSFANEMDDCGAVFTKTVRQRRLSAIFKGHGANLIRIRIWNDADWTEYSNLADVKKSIARAKAQGHESASRLPLFRRLGGRGKAGDSAAWAGIKDEKALAQALYQYTYDTLTALDKDGLMPEMVQTGNEINQES